MIDRISVKNYGENKAEHIPKQSFKGPVTGTLTGLRFLNESPALGACAVDLGSMVIPRTVIEAKNRGKESGIETFFREAASCFLHACVGLIGFGASSILSKNFNKQYEVKAQNIFASGDTIDTISSVWKESNGQKEFFEKFLGNIKGLNGGSWKAISSETKEEVVSGLMDLAEKTKELDSAGGTAKKDLQRRIKEQKGVILAKITKDTGAKNSFKLAAAQEGTKEISAGLSELVDNAVILSNSFADKSKEVFPKFTEALKKNKTKSTIAGLAVCSLLCVSVQPINRWLTKKRTGKDGFVGVENRNTDDSKKFKAAKTALGIAFPAFAISTIGKPILSNIQFNSKIPTLNQFKLIYGLTIGSRFMSARDGNELRESAIKDFLGYTNWLIFGGMVSKLTARAIGGKEIINNPAAQESGKKGIKYAAKWLKQSSVKSFDEVLLPAAKEITKDGKLLKFGELFKNAEPAVKSKVMKIAAAQAAGYLYSGLVLGIGISKLNIMITRYLQTKKDAGENMTKNVTTLNSNGNTKFDTEYLSKLKDNADPIFKEFC